MNGTENKLICLDTNIFIYYFEKDPQFGPFVKSVFEKLLRNEVTAVTSVISFVELLSERISPQKVDILQQLFLETPNLTIYDVTQQIAIDAARIRRNYGFRLPDAIQLATAVYAKADAFITNDERLKKFTEVKVTLLEEIKV